MDSVQKQVVALSHKVDALYQVVEVLSQNVSEAISGNTLAHQEGNKALETSVRNYSISHHSRFDAAMSHKDVLIDGNGMENTAHQSNERELAPEIQIQRLTAQLTAAYNRIAALEEQLLARRIYS